jgi:hypothetical protein
VTESIELPVQFVLDTSAVTWYGINETVGELIAELADEGQCFAVTQASLAQAYASGTEHRLITLLSQQLGCVVVDNYPQWEQFGTWMRDSCRTVPASLHDALVAWMSIRYNCYVLTATPEVYTAIHPDAECAVLEKPFD